MFCRTFSFPHNWQLLAVTGSSRKIVPYYWHLQLLAVIHTWSTIQNLRYTTTPYNAIRQLNLLYIWLKIHWGKFVALLPHFSGLLVGMASFHRGKFASHQRMCISKIGVHQNITNQEVLLANISTKTNNWITSGILGYKLEWILSSKYFPHSDFGRAQNNLFFSSPTVP